MGRRCKVSDQIIRLHEVGRLIVECLDPYGSSESTRIDGTAMSSFVSWDSKITTVNAVLGGVSSFVRQKMQDDGIYEEFLRIILVGSSSLILLS
jgi:hypothetical protein